MNGTPYYIVSSASFSKLNSWGISVITTGNSAFYPENGVADSVSTTVVGIAATVDGVSTTVADITTIVVGASTITDGASTTPAAASATRDDASAIAADASATPAGASATRSALAGNQKYTIYTEFAASENRLS